MGFNFPSSPLVGDTYPVPPVAGVPVYVWDGEKWTMSQSPAVTDVVRYDTAQSLTATQQTQARSNIYAAPYDAMAYSGMQINGGMEVSQELGLAGVSVTTGTLKYVLDGWVVLSGGQTISAAQAASVLPGFSNQLSMVASTANAAPAAGHYAYALQKIEGYRIARLAWGTANAQPITIGFWIYVNRAGTYSGSITNAAANRSYPFSFAVGAATWEYKTVTIPGDTTGTWPKDNSAALNLNFSMMAGSTLQGPANAWAAGNYIAATGTTNGVAATSDVMVITGVTVIPGTQAPTAAQSPNIMRPYGQELVTCQRYYETYLFPASAGTIQAFLAALMTSTYYYSTWHFKFRKRAAPTFALGSGVSWSTATPTINVGLDSVLFNHGTSSFYVAGSIGNIAGSVDARL